MVFDQKLLLCVWSHILLLPLQLLFGLLHFVDAFAEGVVGVDPLCLQLCRGVLDGVADGVSEAQRHSHLTLGLVCVVGGVRLPLYRRHDAACEGGEGLKWFDMHVIVFVTSRAFK